MICFWDDSEGHARQQCSCEGREMGRKRSGRSGGWQQFEGGTWFQPEEGRAHRPGFPPPRGLLYHLHIFEEA